MSCKRCPHHVRHGQPGKDGKTIVFSDMCGLRLKQSIDPEQNLKKIRGRGRPAVETIKRKPLPKGASLLCEHVPFLEHFDYFACKVYQETFESTGLRNGVVPTKDFQFSEQLTAGSVADMELL